MPSQQQQGAKNFSNRSPASSKKFRELINSQDAKGVAQYIKSDRCKNIFIMAGAGISTSAGIPDFRSPDTGLYANLARLNLPFPEAVFEINFFRRNPNPFYTLAHELAPGRYRPTPTHSFIRLLSDKGLLHTHFTQNIDTLERRAGIASEDIIEAHGSFATSRCIDCQAPYDDDMMNLMIRHKEIPRCELCKGLAKPDIVFFGEPLPPVFHRSLPTLRKADLLVVIGTSLTVHPFASLTQLVPPSCPRVLINLEPAGDIGERASDVVLLGQCDDIVREIAKELGWADELEQLWAETADSLDEEYKNRSLKPTPDANNNADTNPDTFPDTLSTDMDKLQLGEKTALPSKDVPSDDIDPESKAMKVIEAANDKDASQSQLLLNATIKQPYTDDGNTS